MRKIYSYLLVIFQFLAIYAIVRNSSFFHPISLIFSFFALALLLWSVWHLRRQLSALPEPVRGKTLIVTGPYKYVRHPIYTSLIIWAIGQWVTSDHPFCLCHFTLIPVLVLKVRHEERLLLSHYSDYASYKRETKALIPFLV